MNTHFKRLLIVCPIVILMLVLIQTYYIYQFNRRVYVTQGDDTSAETYIKLGPRADNTSNWLKRGFIWDGEHLDLKAQTIDGVLTNNSRDQISNWTIKIDISDDCFINNAWCGVVEIHQYVGTKKEKVQVLDLRNYNLDKVELEYYYDGDLLIPLQKGDYIIYIPSEKDSEVPLKGNSECTIGVIFYYFNHLDFFDYSLEYSYHRTFSQGRLHFIILPLFVIWVLGIILYQISLLIYRDAQKKLESKISGLTIMSDIYQDIYIIDVVKDELIPVVEIEVEGMKRPDNLGAQAQLRNLYETDADESYRQIILDFCDMSDIVERLGEKNSIACEYISKRFGWCSARIFVMDRIEERRPDRFLYTIQIIDSEKQEMDKIEQKVLQAEKESRERSSFVKTVSGELVGPIERVLALNKRILDESSEENILDYAHKVERENRRLKSVVENIVYYSGLMAGSVPYEPAMFSLKALLEKVYNGAFDITEKKGILFSSDIAPSVPEIICGDENMLLKILSNMLENGIFLINTGDVKLSVFGKRTGDRVHLVFSVRNIGEGTGDDEKTSFSDQVTNGLLKYMNSELQIVSVPGDGYEAFFELDTETRGEKTLKDLKFNAE